MQYIKSKTNLDIQNIYVIMYNESIVIILSSPNGRQTLSSLTSNICHRLGLFFALTNVLGFYKGVQWLGVNDMN